MQTFDGKSGIIFDSMNEEWKWNPSGEIGKDFIRTNVTDCQGKTFKIYQASISHRCYVANVDDGCWKLSPTS